MIELTPRTFPEERANSFFLAGTIDSGNSRDWQREIIEEFKDDNNVIFFNPRRKNWPKENNFIEIDYQIKWEQEYLDKADYIIMVLEDDSKSPITLLELGLYATSKKLYVFCNSNFYRYNNVRLTCEKYGIPLLPNTNTQIIRAINELKYR